MKKLVYVSSYVCRVLRFGVRLPSLIRTFSHSHALPTSTASLKLCRSRNLINGYLANLIVLGKILLARLTFEVVKN